MSANQFRKVAFFEHDELKRIIQQQIKEYNPQLASMANLQAEMENDLTRKDLDADKKLKLYQAAKHRFDDIKNDTNVMTCNPLKTTTSTSQTKNAVIPPPAPAPAIDSAVAKEEYDEEDTLEEESDDDEHGKVDISCLEYQLPDRFQKKHEQLLEFLKKHQNKISAHKNGSLILNGQIIDGSLFTDLIRSFYLANHSHNLLGRHRLLKVLNELKLPTSFISKKECIQEFESGSQVGQGLGKRKGKISTPPGKRARVLRLYY